MPYRAHLSKVYLSIEVFSINIGWSTAKKGYAMALLDEYASVRTPRKKKCKGGEEDEKVIVTPHKTSDEDYRRPITGLIDKEQLVLNFHGLPSLQPAYR